MKQKKKKCDELSSSLWPPTSLVSIIGFEVQADETFGGIWPLLWWNGLSGFFLREAAVKRLAEETPQRAT